MWQDDDWIIDNEYPDDKDIDEFGDDSPPDDDPLTIGYVGNTRPSFWTTRRVILLVVILIIISALLFLLLLPWYNEIKSYWSLTCNPIMPSASPPIITLSEVAESQFSIYLNIDNYRFW